MFDMHTLQNRDASIDKQYGLFPCIICEPHRQVRSDTVWDWRALAHMLQTPYTFTNCYNTVAGYGHLCRHILTTHCTYQKTASITKYGRKIYHMTKPT